MWLARLGALLLTVVATSPVAASLRCGDSAGDAAAVAAVELDVVGACSCCDFASRGRLRRCAIPRVKQAVVAGLSRRCARRVMKDFVRGCAITRDAAPPCRVCNGDTDCLAGEFCECRPGSCSKPGGVCTARPDACTKDLDPVCGCDGVTYGNDCNRRVAGVCRLHPGECGVVPGGCFDTIAFVCTGVPCSAEQPCASPNGFCTPGCGTIPTTGECFSTFQPTCLGRACGPDAPCLPNEICVETCPPTTTTTLPPGKCASDAACDDGNGCSADRCVEGACVHECLCVGPGDVGVTCCPGPAAECPPSSTSTTSTTLPPPCDPGQCRYYETCGYPVCGGSFDGPITGVDPCTTQQVGDACTVRFATCDPGVGCGVRLVCSDHDPTQQGCPISRRDAKRDISYLDDHDLDRMLDDIRRVRLATYRYKGEADAGRDHLGFIIDDVGTSPAVAADGGHVDLYGYTSMAVAAIQAQQKRIDALEREVAALRRELAGRR